MESHPTPTRKKIRIARSLYSKADQSCSITICSEDRLPRFADPGFAKAVVALLIEQAHVSRVVLHAFCLMPDHLHLLASPIRGASLVDFVRAFKSRSTRLAWSWGQAGTIWQPRFYDHFMRGDEDTRHIAEYILNNPVRRGIVSEWREYPWSGSSADEP